MRHYCIFFNSIIWSRKMKKLLASVLALISINAFAAEILTCPQAMPTNDAGFCGSFKTAATCNCTAKGVPSSLCQNLDDIYSRMLSIFGSLDRACAYQHETDTQTCIDDWNCYRNGGTDSHGRLCSATGNSCHL